MILGRQRANPIRIVASAMSGAANHGLRLWQQLAIAAIVVPVALLGLHLGVLDRIAPVEIEKISLLPDRVAPGSDLQVMISAKVHRYCPGTLTRTIVNAAGTAQVNDQATISFTEDGASAPVIRTMHVPPGFSTGPAVYRSEATFACNLLQGLWPIRVRAPDVPLTVEPPAPVERPAVAARKLVARPRPVASAPAPAVATSPLQALFGR